jgi:hypothetical protein
MNKIMNIRAIRRLGQIRRNSRLRRCTLIMLIVGVISYYDLVVGVVFLNITP